MLLDLAAVALAWTGLALASWRVMRSIGRLEAPARLPAGRPVVGVAVPARDEEDGIEAAMRSLLAQEGVELHVVAVDDGSTDRTGAILDELAAEDRRLEVIHGPELPPGWLGKVNAQHHAVQRLEAPLLLFTDADVVHAPRAVAAAAALMEAEGLDLLALLPRYRWEGVVEHGLVVAITLALLQFGSPHLEDPDFPEQAAGSGAFTMVRREPYLRAGGHEVLRGEVLDDIALGRMMKRASCRVGFRLAPELCAVRMYRGPRAATWGLSKNIVASLEGRVWLAPPAGLWLAWLLLSPPAGVLLGLAWGRPLVAGAGAATYALQYASLWLLSSWQDRRPLPLLGFPFFAVTACLCLARGCWQAVVRRRVLWRGRELRT